ncbi:hypothetical protein PoB_004314500 [Plakobranchus ocellatus]|uniref:Uncharacterized protein n=1 Tax=Plakobranchus ocellatus TaxID=259542 RepID=A0AAV4BAT6_9GAST|nr:hypothetical protein PoB_004314500 [Plakobranchus ocellatus]
MHGKLKTWSSPHGKLKTWSSMDARPGHSRMQSLTIDYRNIKMVTGMHSDLSTQARRLQILPAIPAIIAVFSILSRRQFTLVYQICSMPLITLTS